MKALVKNLPSLLCILVLAGSISACSTVVAPEDDGTTEFVFEKSSDQVLSKDDSGTSLKSEED